MTELAWVLLGGFLAVAAANWYSRVTDDRGLEYVTKPGAMVLLIGVALALDPAIEARRWWFVAALVLSLAGDVFLMLPGDRFVPGLASFLAAHLAYIAGFLVDRPDTTSIVVALVIVALSAVPLAAPIVGQLRQDDPSLTGPVVAYMVVISVMVALALATGSWLAGGGALLFFTSDYLIARERFLAPIPWASLAIMVLYHLGQAGLVLSLVSNR